MHAETRSTHKVDVKKPPSNFIYFFVDFCGLEHQTVTERIRLVVDECHVIIHSYKILLPLLILYRIVYRRQLNSLHW